MQKNGFDLEKLEKLDIVYYSIQLEIKKNDKGKYLYKKKYPDRLIKVPFGIPLYKNKKLKTTYNKDFNASFIPMGEVYDLIGIDIDNKDDTLEKYQELCDINDFDRMTLTMKTMNDGYHEYYSLTNDQKKLLNDFCSLDGKLFDLNIDVKYNNQILFGPSFLGNKQEFSYEIMIDMKPIILPDFIFNEILKNIQPIIKKKIIKEPIKKQVIEKDIEKNKKNNNNKYNEQLELYLECLNINRFEDYKEWIRIGFIIFNEKGSCELYDKYSKKANNYSNECFKKWETFEIESDKKATLKTLKDMAIEDNPDKYSNVFLKDKISILDDIFFYGIGDVTCAYLFFCLYPNNYIYDRDNNVWYKINDYGIYEIDKNNKLLKDHINRKLLKQIEKQYLKKNKKLNDEELKTKLTKTYLSIRKYLIYNKNKNNIIDELSLLYQQSKIYEKFDDVNNNILAFKNGVYDFITHKFRNAYPEELVTCTTGYNYEKPNQETIKELNDIIITIFPEKIERTYLLKTISIGLIGDNILEEFYFWINSNGQNGKGLLRDLICYTLGDYFDNMEIEYLCKTKDGVHANSADPIMAKKKNSRIVISTEPEGDVNLRCAKLKQISGRDPVQVRDLYKTPFNFVPKFKLIIQTNKEPVIDGSDGGVIRRLRFIVFPITFVDEPKLPNEKKVDRTIKPKMKEIKYRLAFFQILLDHYKKFMKNDNNRLDMPPRIKKDTENYLQENDPIKQFIEERIEITDNKKDFISSSELFETFKDFNENNLKGMSTIKFKKALLSKGFEFKKTMYGNGFLNIKLKQINNFKNDLDN